MVLAWVLSLHVLIWTVLPILVCWNLQLDLVEDLALGKEWQLGYWKHPPLPWWIADLAYRITGDVHVVYLLGPLSAAACMYAVWRLGREVVEPVAALVAVLALEGLHYFNFSVVKFAHDQVQLPFWALTGWFVYRATKTGRIGDWILSGALLALCFWSKYAAFALAATIGLFLLLDPIARRNWRTPGPYVMAAAFLAVLAPNIWWLITHDFQPFRYVDARAVGTEHWYDYLVFPLVWTGSQLYFLIPTLALLALLLIGAPRASPGDDERSYAKRYVTALALGPFAVTTLIAALAGRLPVAMWGYPLWSFAPLAALMWFGPVIAPVQLRRFLPAFVAVFVAMPIIYAAIELFEPFAHDRPKATQFPGRLLAETITRQWHARTGSPLLYAGGSSSAAGPGEFAANNVAVYSPDRPHVIVHGDLKLSPWIDLADVKRHGAVFVWQPISDPHYAPPKLREAFPTLEVQPALVLPRQTLYPVSPVVVGYGFVPPGS